MNAVFERDYVAFSSSTRFLLLRAGFAGLMGLLLAVMIVPAYATESYGQVGSTLLAVTIWLGTAVVALATPGSLATVLVHARAANSLPVLLSTPLRPIGIAAGAFAARTGLLLLFVLSTWPPIALALLFGGVRGTQVFEASAAATATMLLLGAPALVISAFARRTAAAVVAAYLAAATILAGLGLAGVGLATWSGDDTLAGALSPYHAIQAALSVTPPPEGSMGATLPGAYILLALAVAGAVLAVVLCAHRLERESRGPDPTLAGVDRTCRPLRHRNPVLDHELRRASLLSPGSPGRWLLALLLATEGVYVATVVGGGDGRSIALHGGVLAFELLLLVLAVAAAGATALAAEKEANTLDLLRAAPIRASEVVLGKLAGILRALIPCMLVPLAHLVYAAWIGLVSPLAIPAVAVVGVVVLSTWAICGLHHSLDQADPRRAVARTVGLLAIIGVLLATNVGLIGRGVFGETDPYVRDCAAFGANPVAAVLLPAAVLRLSGSSAENESVPPPTARQIGTATGVGLVWLLLHLALAHALYRKLFRAYQLRYDG